jgi:hypothetical protein
MLRALEAVAEAVEREPAPSGIPLKTFATSLTPHVDCADGRPSMWLANNKRSPGNSGLR